MSNVALARLRAACTACAALLALALAACEPADDQAHAATRTDEPTTATSAPAAPSASGAAPAPSASAPPPPPVEYEADELPEADLEPATLPEQRAAMVRRMRALGVVDDEGAAAVAALMASSKMMGQGNPSVTHHPLTRTECALRRRAAEVKDEKKPACGAPFMVPLWDPAVEDESSARVCIDRYEFPGLPCEYPVTWVTTAQAQSLCKALGKRLCDAHEWEGACAGAVLGPEVEYAFGRPRQTMQGLHNVHREIRWAYGAEKDHGKCATQSQKSKGCDAPSYRHCGSNTSPAGAFPACRSPFGVYDLHGNAAEHMLLPRKAEELGARGGLGVPEMKGSWFIFQKLEAHKDDCRWRAPAWHDNEGRNHSNYHLGFRCCRDLAR